MGANAQTSVPTFTAGDVLTAANMNISARTGVPVFANTTDRDAAFGGTGEKVLAEGQLAYLEDSNIVQYYDGSSWFTVGPAAAPGLELVKSQTIGTTVSSVTVTDAFSANYDVYRILVNGGVSSANVNLQVTLGATTTGYYYAGEGATFSGTTQTNGGANVGFWIATEASTDSLDFGADISNPFATKVTHWRSNYVYTQTGGRQMTTMGYLNNTTSYTSFTLTLSSGTLTGGTIRVYGYKK